MIPKILTLFLYTTWLQAVYGAAYSKIYVQSGADAVPVEYVKYGAPRVVTNTQIAELSAPPIGSVLPSPNVLTPCVGPCIVTAQAVQAAPPKIISYNAPSVPAVVVPTKDEKSSYEYSYVVYDEDTGDRKAQRELSDGSVVHGEYSFIQPDGYIREVKYTADDLTGFNAVVKNFLPESALADKKLPVPKDKNEPPPCKETKSGAIKVETIEPTSETQPNETRSELEVVPVGPEPVNEKTPLSEAELIVVPAKPSPPEKKPEYDSESHSEHFFIYITESPEEHSKHDDHPGQIAVKAVHVTGPEKKSTEKTHAVDTAYGPDEQSTTQPSAVELIQATNKEDNQHTHESVMAPNPQVTTLNGLSTYNDIIKCLQAAITNRDGNVPNISPLTYIILPAANKPC